MPVNELFNQQSLIFRNKVKKIRSLLAQSKPGSTSISDYPSIMKPIDHPENAEYHNKLYHEYEIRLEEVIYQSNLALQYLREAEKTRKAT